MDSSLNGRLRPAKPSRIGDILRELVISMMTGMAIMFLINLGRPQSLSFRLFTYGALVGLSVYVCSRGLFTLLQVWFRRRGILPPKTLAGAVFFLGGCLGWVLANFFANAVALIHSRLSVSDLTGFAIVGFAALAAGLLFYSFGVTQNRLRESVARLKEAEFAEKELELARAIQRRLLPSTEVEGEGFRVAARNLPARFVAGDFYDVFHLADGTVGLVVADVSGKGIGASLIMASVKAVLPLLAASRSAAATLSELNRKLTAELAAREFVALAYARYQPRRGLLELANAGLPDPYRLRDGVSPEALWVSGPRLPLGVRSDIAYESLRVTLGPGDRVLFLTDGLPEARAASGEPLGYEALVRLLTWQDATPAAWLDRLLEKVREQTSQVLEDDWTVLLLENIGEVRPAS